MQSKGQQENACRNDDNKWILKNPTTNKKVSHHSPPNTNKQKKKTNTARKPLINALFANIEQLISGPKPAH